MSELNPKMNIGPQGMEQDRTVNDLGFLGMTPHVDTNPPTAYEVEGLGVPPGQLTHPLTNAVNPSADSQRIDVGRSAGEITMETRNG